MASGTTPWLREYGPRGKRYSWTNPKWRTRRRAARGAGYSPCRAAIRFYGCGMEPRTPGVGVAPRRPGAGRGRFGVGVAVPAAELLAAEAPAAEAAAAEVLAA